MGAAISFIGSNLDKINLLYQLAETGSVVWQNSSSRRIKEGSKVREVFASISSCLAFTGVLAVVQGKYSLLSRSARLIPGLIVPLFPAVALGAALFVFGFAGFTVAAIAYRFFGAKENLKPQLQKHETQLVGAVKLDLSPKITFIQDIDGIRLVTNLALAYLSANPYLFLATAALEALSLSLRAKWTWISYTREFKAPPQASGATPHGLELNYYEPVSPDLFPHMLGAPNSQAIAQRIHDEFEAFISSQSFKCQNKHTYDLAGNITLAAYEVTIKTADLPFSLRDFLSAKPTLAELTVLVTDKQFPGQKKAAKVIFI
jgi:hypothetical protein